MNAQKVAARFAAEQTKAELLKNTIEEFSKTLRYLSHFSSVLFAALHEDRTGLEPDEVWQDQFVHYWKDWDPIRERLGDLASDLGDLSLYDLEAHIKKATAETSGTPGYNPNSPYQIGYATHDGTSHTIFRNTPQGRQHIAYKVDRLKTWDEAMVRWAKEGQTLAQKLTKIKARPNKRLASLLKASEAQFPMQRLAMIRMITGTSMVPWAKRELELAGLFDKGSDYDGALGAGVLKLVETFASQGHSGGSAGITSDLFNKLVSYEPLTPLGNPTETGEYEDVSAMSGPSGPMYQSTRDFAVFSDDWGKTWYKLVEDQNDPLRHTSLDSHRMPLEEYEAQKFRTARVAFKYEPKETKQSKVKRLMALISKGTGVGRNVSEDIADAIIRNRNLSALAIQKGWPMSDDTIEGPLGSLSVNEVRDALN